MPIKYNKTQLAKISKAYGLKFVILHGSYATGKNRPDSDLDIAVLGKQEISYKKFLNLYSDISDVFKRNAHGDLDIKTLHRVDPLFRFEVIKDGVLLYGDSTAYEQYKAFAYNAYDDAKPLFDLEYLLAKKYQKHLNKIAKHYA